VEKVRETTCFFLFCYYFVALPYLPVLNFAVTLPTGHLSIVFKKCLCSIGPNAINLLSFTKLVSSYTSKLQDLLKFKTNSNCFTEIAMECFLFKPIRKLYNGEIFKINIINQWKIEKIYKVMGMNKDANVKFYKKNVHGYDE
jgi:hypothetical protein